MKKVALLGSTGSIGESTLKVARHLKEEVEIVALAAHSNVEKMIAQAIEFRPKVIALFDKEKALFLKKKVPHIRVLAGMEGLEAVASFEGANFVVQAITGSAGLLPTIAAIKAKKEIGLANKETLVSGGELICRLAKENGVEIIPIDSEHSAIHQCLRAGKKQEVRRLILTASGGAFREKSREELKSVCLADALKHPNWQMGKKVTIDCTTLMNKGLEMIEARFLFDIDPKSIEAVIHPESIIHSAVEFVDGSVMAQLADPDMVLPIQYALTYPERRKGSLLPFDFLKKGTLHFFPPDMIRFPCLQLALDAMKEGRSYPCFLNAANEILVHRFLNEEISFLEIGDKLEKLISSHDARSVLTLEAIQHVDETAREMARTV